MWHMNSKYAAYDDQILSKHSDGLSNRDIAEVVGVPHWYVGKLLKEKNLIHNGTKRGILEIKDDLGRCTKCDAWKPLEEYRIQRPTKSYPYRLTYCDQCRVMQIRKRRVETPESYLMDKFLKLKQRAEKHDIQFDLTLEHLIDQFNDQGGRCFYTNKELVFDLQGESKFNSTSVDKIIPEDGYIDGNIVFCLFRINTIKSNMSLEEMKIWTPLWYEKIERFLQRR